MPLGSSWLTALPAPAHAAVACPQKEPSSRGLAVSWAAGVVLVTPPSVTDAHSKEKICWSRFLRGELNKMLVFSGLWSSLGRAVWAPSCPWEGPVVEERWGRAWHVPSHLRHTSWLVPRRRSCHTVWPRRSGSPSLSWLCLKPSSRDDFLWAACPSHACLPSSVCWRGAAWGAVPIGGVCVWGVSPQGLFPPAAERRPARPLEVTTSFSQQQYKKSLFSPQKEGDLS